tara:strand:+ start:730 stop:1359 length:630 start_codon:yes stop_codon:yes gene_type:complete
MKKKLKSLQNVIVLGAMIGTTIGAQLLSTGYEAKLRTQERTSGLEEKANSETLPKQEIPMPKEISPTDVSQEGLDLIKKYEGFREDAYKCPAGVWTIGYGSTKGVEKGDIITEARADIRLNKYIDENVETVIDRYVKVPLNQNQYDALGSFIYNLGETNFKDSTLLKKLNGKNYEGAANEFKRWNKASGKVLRGLVKRRAEEADLFRQE